MQGIINFKDMNDKEIKDTLESLFPQLRDQDLDELVEFVKSEEMKKKVDLSKILIQDMHQRVTEEIDRQLLGDIRELLIPEEIENIYNNKNINFYKSNIIGEEDESSD